MDTERLVIDANVAIDLAARDILDELAVRLAAPPLMWVETRSALHREGVRSGTLDYALELQRRIERAPLATLEGERQGAAAWDIATELDWEKTYDAEYLAAAQVHGLALVTRDRRMERAARMLGIASGMLP